MNILWNQIKHARKKETINSDILLTATRSNIKINDDNDDDESSNFRESVKNVKPPFKVIVVIRDTKINMIKILDNVLWIFLIYNYLKKRKEKKGTCSFCERHSLKGPGPYGYCSSLQSGY